MIEQRANKEKRVKISTKKSQQALTLCGMLILHVIIAQWEAKNMDKQGLKALSKRKLKEFHRWQRITRRIEAAYDDYYMLKVEGDYFPRVEKLEMDEVTARNELNAIKWAINQIPKSRQRAILIMSYIIPQRVGTHEQMKKLGLAASTYYHNKKQALLLFARYYRQGTLERYEG